MKYTFFKINQISYPVLFPDFCEHSDIRLQGGVPVATGSCTFDGGFIEVDNKANHDTMNLIQGSDDTRLLNALLYDAPSSAYIEYEERKTDDQKYDGNTTDQFPEMVQCSAIWVNDVQKYAFQPNNVETGQVYCGFRHSAIIEQLRNVRTVYPMIQGFLTSKNRFLDCDQAHVLVKENGQLVKDLLGPILTSEDLW